MRQPISANTATASKLKPAVENAFRACLHDGREWNGDMNGTLRALGAPPQVEIPVGPLAGPECLEATERVVGWLASYLRSEAPGRSWGY